MNPTRPPTTRASSKSAKDKDTDDDRTDATPTEAATNQDNETSTSQLQMAMMFQTFQEFIKTTQTQMQLQQELLMKQFESAQQRTHKPHTTATMEPETRPININVPLPTYSGRNHENLGLWKFQVQHHLKAKQVAEHQYVDIAVGLLKDAALNWFHTREIMAERDSTYRITTWDQLTEELRNEFEPPQRDMLIREQLLDIRQIGSVMEYTSRFRNTVNQIPDMAVRIKLPYSEED